MKNENLEKKITLTFKNNLGHLRVNSKLEPYLSTEVQNVLNKLYGNFCVMIVKQ